MKGVIVLLARLLPLFWCSLALAGSPQPAEVTFITTESSITAKAPEPGEKTQIQVYKYEQPNGVVSYSDRSPLEGKYEVLVFEHCFACDPPPPSTGTTPASMCRTTPPPSRPPPGPTGSSRP